MSRTLFLYIFKDLVRIFLLASGGLAGMMSFGALLRPLTEHGLDSSQVAQMLSFLMPAMTTYSLPIAALFATTMVYGRLSADNEITAIRAAGISHLSIAVPALVMGLLVALVSLLFLCFIVPTFTYKVEKVIYSNLARLVANQIDRKHQVSFDEYTIYAEGAYVPEPDPNQPNTQMVVLEGPMVVLYGDESQDPANLEQSTPDDPETPRLAQIRGLEVPATFFLAKEAQILIRQDPRTDSAELEGRLVGGSSFPRQTGEFEGGIAETTFGPFPLESSIEEQTKFMDIRRLQELLNDPGQSRRLRTTVRELVSNDQRARYLRATRVQLNGPEKSVTFESGADRYVLSIRSASMAMVDRELVITSRSPDADDVQLTRIEPGGATTTANARRMRIAADARPQSRQMRVTVTMHRPVLTVAGERTEKESFRQEMVVPMPEDVQQIANQPLGKYLESSNISPESHNRLRRDWFKVTNGIQSELHGRASFAVSCLILVIVGWGLGMMFKSGNFLSAFAVSVVPALLCITLIATGQQTCENIPQNLANFDNATTLRLGLSLIWSGNLAVLAIAVVLMWRLQRQ